MFMSQILDWKWTNSKSLAPEARHHKSAILFFQIRVLLTRLKRSLPSSYARLPGRGRREQPSLNCQEAMVGVRDCPPGKRIHAPVAGRLGYQLG